MSGGRGDIVGKVARLGTGQPETWDQWRTQEFCSGGGRVQQIQLRTEDRENGVLGVVAL